MSPQDQEHVYDAFNHEVNMPPQELQQWLESDASRSVGFKDGGGESVGHASGRRIVEIKRTKKAELTDEHYEHMRKVVGYIHRHLAQRPSGEIEDSPWRYSLMNWGHDPLRPAEAARGEKVKRGG